jgi:hypothetical protein
MKTIEVTLGNHEVPVIYGCREDTELPCICYNVIDKGFADPSTDQLVKIPEENHIVINFLTSDSIKHLIAELTVLLDYLDKLEVYKVELAEYNAAQENQNEES